MLAIDNLSASVNDLAILNGLTLHVKAGEVHAIMGPNGSGKSTLAKVVAGHPAFAVTGGTVMVDGVDLLKLEPEQRAHAGVFIGWQYPIEVPGVNNAEFLRLAYNAKRKATAQPELNVKDFDRLLDEKMAAVEVDVAFKDRQLNAGFSGGQKKRNEILQMVVLEPKLAILDETDSGLDVDALRAVARGINAFRSPSRAIVLITHYERLLELVEPDVVHVLAGGRIVASGGKELARRIETQGYDGLVGGDA
ncbi:MAG: Fe-S cluster assembly ATPase SufC [Planctomycetes bacterium]|nr:Fe-S cluster assembly ATPase SufC [Planctomycetota bacterium]